MKRHIIISIIFLTLFSCRQQETKETKEQAFKCPIIIQPKTSDTIEFFNTNFIRESFPKFAGKSKFCDTLNIPIKYKSDSLTIKDLSEIGWFNYSDTLTTDGFELFTDYKSTVSRIDHNDSKGNYFYPVYIVNQTPTTKILFGSLEAIQEAKDKRGQWKPIEGERLLFCGTGDSWGLKIFTNEFFTFLMPKYEGKYKTKMRVRIRIGDNIYVSTAFEGRINENQFYLDKEKYTYLYQSLLKNKAKAIQELFYGAAPLESEDTNFEINKELKK